MNVLQSFRVRIALLSVALSGIVLFLFASWAWFMVRESNVRRVDDTLRDIMQRHLVVSHDPGHWSFVDQSMQYVFGPEPGRVLILVVDRDGQLIHRSADWPADLNHLPDIPAAAYTDTVPQYEAPLEPDFPPPPMFRDDRPRGPGPPRGDGRQPDGQRRGPPPGGPRGDGPGFGRGPGRDMPGPGRPPEFAYEQIMQLTQPAANEEWRVLVFRNPDVRLAVAVGLSTYAHRASAARLQFLIAFPLALVLIALGSWYLATRAMRPVNRLSGAIAQVTARGLDQRIAGAGEAEEFQQLIAQFNRMMERLERSFTQAARFSADAAHELKTPLAVLQGEIEQAIQSAPRETQVLLSRLLDEVQRLKSITQKLLLLARADAGQLQVHLEPIDLSAMLRQVLDDVEVLAPQLKVTSQIQPVFVQGDRDLLPQVLRNLTDNAIKYNREGGSLHVALNASNDLAVLNVSNTGDIPEAKRARIFDRFVRVDDARTRRVDGAGLGLSLAREIARAHGGDLVLERCSDGVVTFALRLRAVAKTV